MASAIAATMGGKMEGTVESYDKVDKRGRIAVDGSDEPLPFTVLPAEVESFRPGDRVKFELEETRFGRRARGVQMAGSAAEEDEPAAADEANGADDGEAGGAG